MFTSLPICIYFVNKVIFVENYKLCFICVFSYNYDILLNFGKKIKCLSPMQKVLASLSVEYTLLLENALLDPGTNQIMNYVN